jgi:superoxide dismutase, Fe-Mn family
MSYKARSFESLLGVEGFSEELLKNHFKLYEGYVKNTNALLDNLSELAKKDQGESPAYGEQKRRLGWEWNGMRLHELYFENMKKGGAAPSDDDPLEEALKASFGSRAAWEKDFRATAMIRGIGWAVLTLDPSTGTLANAWIDEHDAGHWAGARPLLIMDAFEHAYMKDYGIKRADYVQAFLKAVDWRKVEDRFPLAGAAARRDPVPA